MLFRSQTAQAAAGLTAMGADAAGNTQLRDSAYQTYKKISDDMEAEAKGRGSFTQAKTMGDYGNWLLYNAGVVGG